MKRYNVQCKINEQMEIEAEDRNQALSNFIEWIQNEVASAIEVEEIK